MAHRRPAGGYPHILHLEDDPSDAELVGRMLRAEWPACVIKVVKTRAEFSDGLAEEGLDLILSDFSMPQFDGLSALSLARQNAAAVPFVFMSGTIGEENAVRALHQGATDYVIKDRPGRFVPAVRRALSDAHAETLRKSAEAGLRASEARFVQLAQQTSDVIWFFSCDLMRRTYVSPAFEKTWGVSAAALYSDTDAWERAINPGDRGRVREAFNACILGGSPGFDVEYRITSADGREKWIVDSGAVIEDGAGKADRICGIARDITRLKEAEHSARERAEFLDKARDAIVVANLSRKIIYWNSGAERALKLKATEAINRDAQEVFGHEAFSQIEKALLPASQGEWNGLLRLKSDGAEIVLDCRVTVMRNEAGRPDSYLIFGSDVTERLSIEQQFLRSQRLESVGLLAGGVAHDLNNALAPILMGIELLRKRIADAEQVRLLGVMDSSARHGAALVRQVLDFSRGAEGEHTPIDAGAVIRDVVRLMAETLPKSIAISSEIAEPLARIESNATHLSQVLINLCVNGRDAMPEGGHLMLGARNVEVDASLARANNGTPGPHVLLSVADNGSGIPREILDRIFDPFFTTKTAGKGTGLGLSTVLGIMKSHHGFIAIQTGPGEGTQFSLYFPACEQVAPAPAPSPAQISTRGHGEKILVIDDEENILTITRLVLDSVGYRTVVTTQGAEGLDIYLKQRDEIGAVIVDIMMPKMQGTEVIKRLREINPSLKIIATSGVRPSSVGLVEEPGRTFFLPKPMNAAQLLNLVQTCLSSPRS